MSDDEFARCECCGGTEWACYPCGIPHEGPLYDRRGAPLADDGRMDLDEAIAYARLRMSESPLSYIGRAFAALLAETERLETELAECLGVIRMLHRRGDEAEAEVERLRDSLSRLIDPDPCWFDHGGGCQAHGFLSLQSGEVCPNAEATSLLEDVALGHSWGEVDGDR